MQLCDVDLIFNHEIKVHSVWWKSIESKLVEVGMLMSKVRVKTIDNSNLLNIVTFLRKWGPYSL